MSNTREEYVYMAKLAEQAERYEEMVEFMEKVTAAAADGDELTVEERNLLSVAYKNVIGARRASWRIVSSIEQKEESRGNEDHVTAIRDYRSKIESELTSICDGILKLLDTNLVPAASASDSKVFYLKMKGDYHRYLAEFKTGDERKAAAESTLSAYKAAQIFNNMTCSDNPKFIDHYKKKYFPMESLCLFQDCHVYFYEMSIMNKDLKTLSELASRRMKLEITMSGGEICDSLSHATHIVVYTLMGYHNFDELYQSFLPAQRKTCIIKNCML